MSATQNPFKDEADLQAMAALVNAFPAENMHVTDLPYRFSSWALDYPENVGLWRDEGGDLLGWAAMQTPFWTIDYACHPEAERTLHPKILAWADERARAIVDGPSGRPIWFINVFTTQRDRMRELEEAGYASQADVGENSWTKVLMRCDGSMPVAEYDLPSAFVIRPLAGESEVQAYVDLHRAVFESNSMTSEWRLRTLQRPEYIPELDLVAVAPDGRLAAFCVCWLNSTSTAGVRGRVEPLGVHADFRKLGMGRGILSNGLRRLQDLGAESMYVETDNYRDEAFLLYEAVGFRTAQDVLVYRKDDGSL